MKAKLVNEDIKHLTPRSSEEIKKSFEKKFNMPYETFQSYLKELRSLGIEILEAYEWQKDRIFRHIEIQSFEVYEGSWNIAKCVTKKDAERIKEAHEKYTWSNNDFFIKQNYMYVDVVEMKRLIEKLKETQNESEIS